MSEEIFASRLFAGKHVLITGGGTGIGYAIAHRLGRLGANVIIAARREEVLEKAVHQLQEEGISADYFSVNIRDSDEVDDLFEKMPHIDFLVNNAGGQFASDALAISPNGFRAVVDLNLQGTWHMCHAFAQRLADRKQPGKMINIVLCLQSGMPGMVHAAAARAGVVNMTKTLAYEWGKYGIQMNAVAPGTIETDGLNQYDPDHLKASIKDLPIPRAGKTGEVADAVAFLLSPAGNYITGTTLEIDGGEHLLGARSQL